MTWWLSFGTGKSHKGAIAALLLVMAARTAVAHEAPALGVPENSPPIPVDWFLTTWNWRPDVILIVATFGAIYIRGWWRLRRQGARVARRWQFAIYLSGLVTICLALLSPIETFGSSLFFMHMIQHKLLTMLAPPLLLLADPLPVILWGLPGNLRHEVGRLLTRHAPVRRGLWVLTFMPVAWLLFAANLWLWHLPAAYEAALRNDLIHDLEHLAFFLTALLFWWPITNPAPRLHGHVPYGLRIVYVVAAAFQNTALGFLIAVSNRILYPHYASIPRLWDLDPLYDQGLGGGIMSEGGMMHGIALLVLVVRMLDREERMTQQREARASVYSSYGRKGREVGDRQT